MIFRDLQLQFDSICPFPYNTCPYPNRNRRQTFTLPEGMEYLAAFDDFVCILFLWNLLFIPAREGSSFAANPGSVDRREGRQKWDQR